MPFSEVHFPYAWAAYRRGAFEQSPLFKNDPDMDVAGFTARLADFSMEMVRRNNEMIIGVSSIPVGMISVEYSGSLAIPHVAWFPEATPRNRLEIALKTIMELKKNHMVLITNRDQRGEKSTDVKFYEHLCKYGVLRRVGTIHDYFEPNVNGVLFQSVGR